MAEEQEGPTEFEDLHPIERLTLSIKICRERMQRARVLAKVERTDGNSRVVIQWHLMNEKALAEILPHAEKALADMKGAAR